MSRINWASELQLPSERLCRVRSISCGATIGDLSKTEIRFAGAWVEEGRGTHLLDALEGPPEPPRELPLVGDLPILEGAQVRAQERRDLPGERNLLPADAVLEKIRHAMEGVDEGPGGLNNLRLEVPNRVKHVIGIGDNHVGREVDLGVDGARDEGLVLPPPVAELDDAQEEVATRLDDLVPGHRKHGCQIPSR